MPIIHIFFLFLLLIQFINLIRPVEQILYYYLNLSFDDYDDNNHIKNQNEKFKTKIIWINNNFINIKK